MIKPSDDRDEPLAKRFFEFIERADFPCVGAKSALGRGQLRAVVCRDLRSAWDDLRIHPVLMALARDYAEDPVPFQSLAVLFEQDAELSEAEFETAMWQRIQSLSDKDEWLGQPLDSRVSPDPDDPHFSLSFGGEAFFVVGLHPRASRPARRFERPALVFNLHDQFEQLRNAGRYEKLRGAILARDLMLAGSENPMLARHGSTSEARQYSGREVANDWGCPFQPRERKNAG
ncbi:guanitoxin biosynthesis heme-dependent pre-guanitoxin N-hydroxylase GntA [Blastomonas sp.]|uniref:guanitoxin biosynthesis heme-dependent pre-guanitoxin N-hydroxylase GntA n=1 Tax=Blastomonas sp. TaxID=1909299 RepID=UPI00359308E8